ELFSLGVVSNRDEWVYDLEARNLKRKITFFIDCYNKETNRWHISEKNIRTNDFVDRSIKWTSELENAMVKNIKLSYNEKNIVSGLFRPFCKKLFYFAKHIAHRS